MIEIGKNNDLHTHYFFFLSVDPPPTELFKDFLGQLEEAQVVY